MNPWANWEDFADEIFQCKEKKAIEAFKAQLSKQRSNECDCVECVSAVTAYIGHCENFIVTQVYKAFSKKCIGM